MEARSYEIEAAVERHHWWFEGRRAILRRLLSRASDGAPYERALEVGCGTGANADPLRAMARWTAGAERDPRPLALAARRRPRHHALLRADARHLPCIEGGFDLVLALDLLEHLDDDASGVGELHRVLRPGGVLVVFVPALPLLWGLQDRVAHHRRRYRREQLRELLQGAGLQIERLTAFNTLLFAPILAARLSQRIWTPPQLESENQIGGPLLNRLLQAIFTLEAPLLERLDLPVGVSLAAVARRP